MMWMLQMHVACYRNWQSLTMTVMFCGAELNPIWYRAMS